MFKNCTMYFWKIAMHYKKILSIQTHVNTIYVQINRDTPPNSLRDPKGGSKVKQPKNNFKNK
jgi:hypothetical protein